MKLIYDVSRHANAELGNVGSGSLAIGDFKETMGLCGTQDRISNKINVSNGINGAARQD